MCDLQSLSRNPPTKGDSSPYGHYVDTVMGYYFYLYNEVYAASDCNLVVLTLNVHAGELHILSQCSSVKPVLIFFFALW